MPQRSNPVVRMGPSGRPESACVHFQSTNPYLARIFGSSPLARRVRMPSARSFAYSADFGFLGENAMNSLADLVASELAAVMAILPCRFILAMVYLSTER